MGRAELGRRLKEARLARKMTQSEVVGDFITRNMLSQIESGVAMPSVKTLEYLSKKLEIPFEQLMADEEREETTLEILLRAKEHFKKGRYEEVIGLLEKDNEKVNPIYDEAGAMLARCYLHLALQLKDKLDGKWAVEHADEVAKAEGKLAGYAKAAGRYASEGIYASKEIRMEALVLEHLKEERGLYL